VSVEAVIPDHGSSRKDERSRRVWSPRLACVGQQKAEGDSVVVCSRFECELQFAVDGRYLNSVAAVHRVCVNAIDRVRLVYLVAIDAVELRLRSDVFAVEREAELRLVYQRLLMERRRARQAVSAGECQYDLAIGTRKSSFAFSVRKPGHGKQDRKSGRAQ